MKFGTLRYDVFIVVVDLYRTRTCNVILGITILFLLSDFSCNCRILILNESKNEIVESKRESRRNICNSNVEVLSRRKSVS